VRPFGTQIQPQPSGIPGGLLHAIPMPSTKPFRAKPPTSKIKTSKTPSPLVIKLQIAGGVFVPMLALGLWLRSQGFW
jgi:hypothetical protein